jgi:hypothetical protein
MASNQPHGPMARLGFALGGIGVLVALAEAEKLIAGTIGGARGRFAAILVAGAVFGCCRLAHSLRRSREPGLTRPAPVRLPERGEHLEPANSAT